MLKAYKLSCADDDHGQQIRFAERGSDLRGWRACDFCDCEYIDLKVHRAKQFDKYAPGPMTVEDYLNEGWYWECAGCSKHCYADDQPIVIGDRVYHRLECVIANRRDWPEDTSKNHESVRRLCLELDAWLKDMAIEVTW